MGGGRDGIGGGIVRKKTKNKLFDEIKNLAGVTFFHFRGRNEEGTREKERMGAREGKGMGERISTKYNCLVLAAFKTNVQRFHHVIIV